MTILSHFENLSLTADQTKAIENINSFLESREDIFILQGYAGTGKTTLLKGIVEHLRTVNKKFQLMAPTGRAAKVISQKTGYLATTVHKAIYNFESLKDLEVKKEESTGEFIYTYKLRSNELIQNTVLLIDEASMLSNVFSQGEFFRFGSGYLLNDLLKYSGLFNSNNTTKIVFIGDPAQLPPIGMKISPALDPLYLKENFKISAKTAELKEIKRLDSDNGILAAAGKIRKSITAGVFNDFDLRSNNKDIFNPSFVEFLTTYKSLPEPKIIITYKNKTALDLNQRIREDKWNGIFPIKKGDRVIIGVNNYKADVMNGEFGIISEASIQNETRIVPIKKKDGKGIAISLSWRNVHLLIPDDKGSHKAISCKILENYLTGDDGLTPDEQRALFVDFKNRNKDLKSGTEEFKEAISTDPYFNCLMIKYGYAVTCHKAQGGEWKNAFVFWDRGTTSMQFDPYTDIQNKTGKTNSDFYRWAYTAITRASSNLYCINPPYFTSFSHMTFIEPEVQVALEELTGKSKLPTEIEVDNNMLGLLEINNLSEKPISIQDHFIKKYKHLSQSGISIIQWEQKGYEIRYQFKRNEDTVGVIYWINGKNLFTGKYKMLPATTNSESLFNDIMVLQEKEPPMVIIRQTAETILSRLQNDYLFESENPFLESLYEALSKELKNKNIHIEQVEHLAYRERYYLKKGQENLCLDFIYDGNGFFGNVVTVQKKSMYNHLPQEVKECITNLKTGNYVL